jgi:hypothetical protein
MLRDDDAFPMPLRSSVSHEELNHNTHYENDDFDDVFGSEPDSPTHRDDQRQGNDELSDIPKLKDKHETEGYRDGVTKGKGKSVQAGFDEGYGLGATLGLRVGKILGLLDGIYSAICAADDERLEDEKTRIGKLFDAAKNDLSTQNVFGKEWWGEDGIWKYDVPGEGEGKDIVFPDVAAAHPLVVRWEENVAKEVATWSLDLGILDYHHGDTDDAGEGHGINPHKPSEGKEVAAEPLSSSTRLFMGIPKKDLNW